MSELITVQRKVRLYVQAILLLPGDTSLGGAGGGLSFVQLVFQILRGKAPKLAQRNCMSAEELRSSFIADAYTNLGWGGTRMCKRAM